MRAVPLVSLVLASVLQVACIAGRTGAAVLPARYEVAPVTSSVDGDTQTGVRYAAGLSWASASPKARTPVDVVLGYGIDRFGELETEAPGPVEKASSSESDEPSRHHLAHGPFLEVAKRMMGDSKQRLWLGIKTELLLDNRREQDGAGLGVATRLGWELFHAAKKDRSGAGVFGVIAIGLFAEAGVRVQPSGDAAIVGVGGLSVRLPLVVAD